MLIARVTLGDFHVCQQYLPVPYKVDPNGQAVRIAPEKSARQSKSHFDSVIGETCARGAVTPLKYREYIVYDRTQAYPEYLVTYTRRPHPNLDVSDFSDVKGQPSENDEDET
eukprot:TRINITY_DN3127_c0_g1_i1.p1 TRINITY_DN3127_c0_g1~~TRINITY_DN3127_c0_g1_i1.p1  ORF type:complete len:112 (+),score=18.19 TRINITY_DN3127_c0_g1_i1:212-547(+)